MLAKAKNDHAKQVHEKKQMKQRRFAFLVHAPFIYPFVVIEFQV